MFRCQKCNAPQGKGVRPIRVVTERRDKIYKDDKGYEIGIGWEIVKELNLCSNCAK